MMNDTLINESTYELAKMEFDLYIVKPTRSITKPLPAIFIAHAWDGLNQPIKDIAQNIAKLGYVAVAVDVYGKGVRGDPIGDNTLLMAPLLEDRALLRARIEAAYHSIRKIEGVDSTRIGAIGYCFGGLCALDLARLAPNHLKGVVSFHGGLTGNGLKDTKPINASILIEHGWDDPVVPINDYLSFTEEMKKRNADWQAHIHGDAMHAFTFKGANMPSKGIQYHEMADCRSWKSMVDFFASVF